MTTLTVGKSNYNANNSAKLVFYRLGMKDNQRELTLRIAPPIKDLAEKGYIAVYVKQHFGYSIAGKDNKRIPVTFNCIERRGKDKKIVQECPECNEIAARKADLEAKEARYKADGTAAEVVEAALRPAKAWLKEHNLDKKWNLNAKNEAGVWGYLAIGHKCYDKELLPLLKKLQTSMSIEDPTGVEEGVWLKFTRLGDKFNDIADKVEVVQVSLGKGQTQIKTDTLNEKDFSALEAMPSLTTLGRRLTYEQIATLVESGGDEEVVKAVFNSSSPRSEKGETSPVSTSGPTTQVSTAPVAPAPTAATPTSVPPSDLQAQIAALQAQLAASSAPPAVKTPSPTVKRSLEMDADKFLAEFGNPSDEE